MIDNNQTKEVLILDDGSTVECPRAQRFLERDKHYRKYLRKFLKKAIPERKRNSDESILEYAKYCKNHSSYISSKVDELEEEMYLRQDEKKQAKKDVRIAKIRGLFSRKEDNKDEFSETVKPSLFQRIFNKDKKSDEISEDEYQENIEDEYQENVKKPSIFQRIKSKITYFITCEDDKDFEIENYNFDDELYEENEVEPEFEETITNKNKRKSLKERVRSSELEIENLKIIIDEKSSYIEKLEIAYEKLEAQMKVIRTAKYVHVNSVFVDYARYKALKEDEIRDINNRMQAADFNDFEYNYGYIYNGESFTPEFEKVKIYKK